tara:strand:- start:20398 stop:20679 length:282 start_codon:yes stop_codon:yes gene_type:complete
LGDAPRTSLQGKRWLIINSDQLDHATSALVFSELEDVLVAVDHRGTEPVVGLWMRAVHLLLVNQNIDAASLQQQSGITKVIAEDSENITQYLW